MENQNKTIQLKIRLSESDYNQIQKNAKAFDQTVSAYIRQCALNTCIVPIDLSIITEHTEKISAYQNAVNHLIYTIRKTGNYTPPDLEYIFERTRDILKIEKRLLELYTLHVDTTEKTVRKAVRDIINSRFDALEK